MTEKVKKLETEGNYSFFFFFPFLPATPTNKYSQLASLGAHRSHTLRLPACSECLKGLNILESRAHTQKTWRSALP